MEHAVCIMTSTAAIQKGKCGKIVYGNMCAALDTCNEGNVLGRTQWAQRICRDALASGGVREKAQGRSREQVNQWVVLVLTYTRLHTKWIFYHP